MDITALRITIGVVIVLVLLFIFEMLRRKVLREKYAIIWLTTALLTIVASLFPYEVNRISRILGFQTLSNFIFLILGLVNLLVLMHLSLVMGKTEDQVQTLAEEVALLIDKSNIPN